MYSLTCTWHHILWRVMSQYSEALTVIHRVVSWIGVRKRAIRWLKIKINVVAFEYKTTDIIEATSGASQCFHWPEDDEKLVSTQCNSLFFTSPLYHVYYFWLIVHVVKKWVGKFKSQSANSRSLKLNQKGQSQFFRRVLMLHWGIPYCNRGGHWIKDHVVLM